jgi:hypothetical protein
VKVKGRFRKKICEIIDLYQLLVTARKYDQPMYFFSKRVKKSRKGKSYFSLLSLHFFIMRSHTFEFLKKAVFLKYLFLDKSGRPTFIIKEFDSSKFGI